MSRILNEINRWCAAAVSVIPGTIGARVRGVYWGFRMTRLGRASVLGAGITVTGPKNIAIGDRFHMLQGGLLFGHDGLIKIGNDVSTNSNVYIGASDGGEIMIGDGVAIGPNVVLRASNHRFERRDIPIREQGHAGAKIIIEEDVWLGANAVVTAGVTIGAHAVVGAGAVVTRDVEPWAVVGGVPARFIRHRNQNSIAS